MGVYTKISDDLHDFFRTNQIRTSIQWNADLENFFQKWIAVNSQLIEEEWKLVAEEDKQKQNSEHYEYSKHGNPAFTIGKETDSFDIEDEVGKRCLSMDVGTQCNPQDFGFIEAPLNLNEKIEDQIREGADEKGAEEEEQVTTTGGRPLDEIKIAWKTNEKVTPGEALRLLNRGFVKHRELESRLEAVEAIAVRRAFVGKNVFRMLPFRNYDYKYVTNSCCENVIGYMPLPVGIAGPLRINDYSVNVPMATTEGALVASTNRGCRVLQQSKWVRSLVSEVGMTRAPVVEFDFAIEVVQMRNWLENEKNFDLVKKEFESTSKYAKLRSIRVVQDGKMAFIRFVATTGDAMGMNMVSKGTSAAIKYLNREFKSMKLISLSGNYCVDKKAAAINYMEGRGREVVAEAEVPASVCEKLLHTTPKAMAEAANAKLRIGSDRAVCLGGNNAHAANIVAAIFLATGQDAAQVVSSSMCSTRMEVSASGDLYVSVTLPCLEVGTVGGGTILLPQRECLQLLGCAGPCQSLPGGHANRLAEVIAVTVMAGELSLMAALVTDELVSSHMKLNRSRLDLYPSHSQIGNRPLIISGVDITQNLFNRPIQPKPHSSQSSNCSNIL